MLGTTAAARDPDEGGLREASSDDVDTERDWSERLAALLARGDRRDRAAEVRDRAAELRSPAADDPDCWLDRDWAGRDRDDAAGDRSDLLDMLRERGMDRPAGSAQEETSVLDLELGSTAGQT